MTGFFLYIFTFFSLCVAQVPEHDCESALLKTTRVPLQTFVFELFKTGNIHDLMDKLETIYGDVNFRVSIGPHRKLYILQERGMVGAVMREHSRLPFVNRNFDLSHGHFNSINSVNTTDPLWFDLHNELNDIFKTQEITSLLEKNKDILIGRKKFNLNETLEEFYMRVWAEYCFGTVDFEKFKTMRAHLIDVLGKVFHQNRFNRLPVLGNLTSRLNRLRYSGELAQVDRELSEIVKGAISQEQGAFYHLYQRLLQKYPNALQITLDNSFLAVLVYDFIYIVMLDALAHIAQDPQINRAQQIKTSRHNGFLYPFRFRIVENDFEGFHKGDFVVVNLQKSGLYFSAGARFCPGATLFGEIARKTLEILSEYRVEFADPSQRITRSPNKDLPFMTSTHDVQLFECPYSKAAKTAGEK